jgi:hypothetical protein
VRVGRAVALSWRRRGRAAAVAAVAAQDLDTAPWRRRWSTGDRIAIGLLVVCALLIATAPLLTVHSWQDVVFVLAQELRPLPS